MADRCPSCATAVVADAKFCSACGSPMSMQSATAVAPQGLPPRKDRPPRAVSGERLQSAEGRFIPGTLLAGRYRLVALLGRGGMGEVYRAEDTRLGQTVALKFLPDSLAHDPDMLERFYAEVRIGRQVSHPNVCRLHDLIEIDGHHCLSMEYVDGEDLSALLARIGRLPADKAVDIARDLCAGLAAAHDKGVIHRDLKPANVMIDGKGRARIADFGIAALADSVEGEAVAGTPAYMAPEVIAGLPASIRSDIYALGLVLYELCTGKRLFQARTLEELRALQQAAEPPSLSSSARDIPAALERVILRCLDKDPEARPTSAHAVMAALPGGDPLQAAIAAGETPSPAMVAAAGKVGALPVGLAWVTLLSGLLGLLLVAFLAGSSTLIGRMHPEKSPEILAEKAREILARLGYDQPAGDSHRSYAVDTDYLAFMRGHPELPSGVDTIAAAQPGPLWFLYRQSPRELVAGRTLMRPFGPSEAGRVTRDDPPTNLPGMVDVLLDRHGRLIALRAVAPATHSGAATEPDWTLLLAAAGFDPGALKSAMPRVTVPVDTDHRAAWEGSYPGQDGVLFHIEAAAMDGRPVWFGIQGPWTPPTMLPLSNTEFESANMPPALRVAVWTLLICSLAMWVVIGVNVRRNLRAGRGDRKGALRLSLFLLCSTFVAQLLRADHVALAFDEAALVLNLLAQVLLYAVISWLIYIALEPIARRRWPQLLVAWSRLLAGRWLDPMVGRDVLIGALTGIAMALVVHLAVLIPAWISLSPPVPRGQIYTSLGAIRHLGYFVFWSPFAAVTIGFGTLLGLFLNRVVWRNQWLALGMLSLSLYFGLAVFTGVDEVWTLAGAIFTAIYVLVALRVGLLAAVASFYVYLVLEATPLTLNLSVWYSDRTLASFALLGGLLVYGFKVSLAGKPVFGDTLAEREAH